MEKSLCEQGVEESAILTLRKKFFFSDRNIHCNDPVQLNLLYVQLKDTVVKGNLPCTRDESIKLAALDCQIQYGNHDENRHKSGFLDLHKFLPNQYRMLKGIEKSIYDEHRKLYNLRELNAKLRYIQLCQSLNNYGTTFFLVKELTQHQKKLVPCLLGITRHSIIKADYNTKTVLKTWPLSTVRRWGTSPKSFTLDFGDHPDSVYSVQTSEGDKISRLIAGYIDITTKKIQLQSVKDEDEMSTDNLNAYLEGYAAKSSIGNELKGYSQCLGATSESFIDPEEEELELLQERNSTQEDYEAPELPKRTYLQDIDFVSEEFEFLFRHPPAIPPRSAKHKQTVGIPLIPGESVVDLPNQLVWHDRETEKRDGCYMTLIRTQESIKDSHDSLYQSLICGQMSSMKHSQTSDSLETPTAENDYQQLDLTRINCDSTVYQELIPFHKD